MKNKAFTLIELLAVIVILAIIALIAVPIVLNIINDAKESSDKRSIELYGKAVENAVGQYQVKYPHDTDITFAKVQPYIKYKGNEIVCDPAKTNINKDGTVYLSGCKVEEKDVDYTYGVDKRIFKPAIEENKTVVGTVPTGNFDLGDEYIVNVDGTHEYHFYVLSEEEGDKVNLIMSRNICSDGTLATETNTCKVAWVSKEDYKDDTNYENNNKGPITAMNYLYEATKNWSNIENINMNYTDEGNHYEGITTTRNITTITMKAGTVTKSYENLKARLPKHSEIKEIKGAGCTSTHGSCAPWMVNGLNAYAEKYAKGTKEDISEIYGYWSLSSHSSSLSIALAVDYYGHVSGNSVGYVGSNGVRPVITISKSKLS